MKYNWIPLIIIWFLWTGVLFSYLHWSNKSNLYKSEEFESKDYVSIDYNFFYLLIITILFVYRWHLRHCTFPVMSLIGYTMGQIRTMWHH